MTVKYGLFNWNSEPSDITGIEIFSNIINDEILDSIDTFTDCVCFSSRLHPSGSNVLRDRELDFNVSIEKWSEFCKNKKSIVFFGILTDKHTKFTAEHLKCAPRIEFLHLGASNYPLFEGDNPEDLPDINLTVNGFGLVNQSDTMEKWIVNLQSKGKKYVFLV